MEANASSTANGEHAVVSVEANSSVISLADPSDDVPGCSVSNIAATCRDGHGLDEALVSELGNVEEATHGNSESAPPAGLNGLKDNSEPASISASDPGDSADFTGEDDANGPGHLNGNAAPYFSKPGDVVWVKIQKHRWPCVVQDPLTCPEGLVGSLRRKPLAIVKFLGEDKYELIPSEDRMAPYDHPDKLEFIKKTMKLLQGDLLDKFRNDVDESERIMGSDADVWEKVAEEERALAASKKTLKAAFGQHYEIVEERIHHMTFIGDPCDAFVDRETEFRKIATEVRGSEEYKCPWCDFVTTRVDNVVFHIKVHSANGPRFQPQLGVKAWMAAREQSLVKEKRRRMKQIARSAAKVPIVLGPDGKRTKKVESPEVAGVGAPSKKRRKREEKKVPDPCELAADWEEVEDEEEERPTNDGNERVVSSRESFLERQKQSENMFDALLRNESSPRQSKFNRFCLPASTGDGNVDDDASENGVAGDSMSDGVFDDDDDDFFAVGGGQSPCSDDGDEEEVEALASPRSCNETRAATPGVESNSVDGRSEVPDGPVEIGDQVVEADDWTFEEYSSVSGDVGDQAEEVVVGDTGSHVQDPSFEEETAIHEDAVDLLEEVPKHAGASADEESDGATLATVEIPEGDSISSSGSRPAVIVAQKDPETGEEKMLLVTVDDAGKVLSITPLDALSAEEQSRLAREIGLSSNGRGTLPEQLSSRFSEENSVVTVGNISAEGAEAAVAVIRENPSIEEGGGASLEES